MRRALPRTDVGILALVFLATFPIELLLEERKYAMFAGGFGQSQALNGPGEIALFLLATLLAHALLLGFAFLLFRGTPARPGRRAARLFSFAFFAILAASAFLVAKLELFSYFSDAVSFTLIRNLGGGSLADAALFAASESTLYLVAGAGALAAFALVLWLVRRRGAGLADMAPPFGWRALGMLALVTPFVAFAADRTPNVRYAANRMDAFLLVNQALSQATDFDRDGYSFFTAQIDDAPFDASRHPLALDIPGDGIDQDGLAGDFHAGPPPALYAPPPLAAHPKHLVLIVLESTRFDVLGKRIDGKPVAPNLETLVRSGSLVPEAYSHVGYTTGSLKSLFGGRLEMKPGGRIDLPRSEARGLPRRRLLWPAGKLRRHCGRGGRGRRAPTPMWMPRR